MRPHADRTINRMGIYTSVFFHLLSIMHVRLTKTGLAPLRAGRWPTWRLIILSGVSTVICVFQASMRSLRMHVCLAHPVFTKQGARCST